MSVKSCKARSQEIRRVTQTKIIAPSAASVPTPL
jgi:hypothetical protein